MADRVRSKRLTSTLWRAIHRRRARATSTIQTRSMPRTTMPFVRSSAAARPMTGRYPTTRPSTGMRLHRPTHRPSTDGAGTSSMWAAAPATTPDTTARTMVLAV